MGPDNGTENVESKGSLFIVDPNPPGRDMIPPEDMFIYVKFTATPRSRFIYGGLNSSGEPTDIENGVEDQVSFISTQIRYNSSGELASDPQNTYATTSWTNIGGLGPTESRGVLEGFGIKSIDIKYNASLVPVVDITFTDVRGAGLFDTIKDKERLSPYSVFFKMPYPVFNLSVKGYFGQSVDYCLHMVNWTSNFDGTTGNFDITANFLGFQQAFLNDMNMGNIIGTVNTEKGFNNLNKIFEEQEAKKQELTDIGQLETLNKDGINVRKIDDFFTKIAKLQIDTEVLKADSDEFDRLKQINGQLSLLKSIRSFIGSPIGKTSDSDNDGTSTEEEIRARKGFTNKDGEFVPPTKNYFELLNNKSRIITSKIQDNVLQRGDNYLSIRDYLLINSTQQSAYKIYMETLHGVIEDYIEYSSKIENPVVEDKDMISSFKINESVEKYWELFAVNELDKNGKPDPLKLFLVLDRMSTPKDSLNLKNTYKDAKIEANEFFNMKSFTAKTDSNAFYNKNKGLSKDSNVLVIDFREQRDRVEGLYDELKIVAKEERKKVQLSLNIKITENFQNALGFKPTVDNCFRILCNNTQAMTSTIYDITTEASNTKNGPNRREALEGYKTDVPDTITDPMAWPLVYSENDNGNLEEIYIGDDDYDIDTSSFPEVQFVEEVFTNLIAKTKTLEQTSRASVLPNGLDTDNWVPINPIDYKVNPWIPFSTRNTDPEMNSFIAENLFNRVAVLKNYSKWSRGEMNNDKFAAFDGIAANKAFITPDIRNIYKNKLEELKLGLPDSIMGTTFGKQLELNGNDFIYKGTTPSSISGINIGGTNQKDVDYILFDNKGIVFNSKRLPSEILQNSRYTAIKNIESNGDFYIEEYRNSNINTKIAYNVWDPKVSKELDGKNNQNYFNFKINSLASIDLTGTTAPDNLGSFLNRTNFTAATTTINGVTINCPSPQFLIQSDFYQLQNNVFAKAILLLSTLPFKTFKEAVLDVAFPNDYKNAKIINLPEYYIYFIGGYLWKWQNGGINWNIPLQQCTYSTFSSPNGEYLTNVGYLATTDKNGKSTPLEPELLNLPTKTKNLFIEKFENWANSSSFKSFEFDMKTYRSDIYISPSQISSSAADIKRELSKTTNMIILAPGIFENNGIPENLKVSQIDIENYINSFLITYKDLENEIEETSQSSSDSEVSSNPTTNKIKLQIYNYFKNINDKWVSDTKKSFNVCGGSGGDLSLYDYFKFVDRGWNDIGDAATINLSSFLTLGSNLQTSVYFFMTKLLRDSNFLFQILPTYINYTDPNEISKMFKPVTTIKNDTSSGPIYCCIYVGGASQALDIGEENTYAFANDGFTLDDPTADIVNDGGNSLVAFRVGFGAENQTIFKNVSLSQQEHKETGEYFRALSELVDKRGGTQKVYQGTDLLRLFKTRSYTCKVDALGCMNIQPLMYFNLENVPFFNGAYLITSVNHNISPNHMTTNFQGVRQSKYISKPNTEILADLNLDLNETSELPQLELKNLKTTNPLWKIGVLDPQEQFKFGETSEEDGAKWTVGNFKAMGVDFKYVKGLSNSSESEIQAQLDILKGNMKNKGINTNSQVCMFIANVMVQSDYLLNNETSWSAEDSSIKQLKFDSTNSKRFNRNGSEIVSIYSGTNLTMSYGQSGVIDDIGTLRESQPVHTGTSVDNFAYESVAGSAYEEDNDYQLLMSSLDDAIKRNKLPTSDSNYLTTKKLKEIKKNFDSQVSGFTYFNIYPGDGWRFKPRGYLYITGRREYFEYKFSVFLNPNIVSGSFIESFNVAIYNWLFKKPSKEVQKKYKNAWEVAGGDGTDKKRLGSSSDFALTNSISCKKTGVTIREAYNAFESVLLAFDLKNDDNP